MAIEGQNLFEVGKTRHLSLALFAWLEAKRRLMNRNESKKEREREKYKPHNRRNLAAKMSLQGV